jgi:hypothetical protein
MVLTRVVDRADEAGMNWDLIHIMPVQMALTCSCAVSGAVLKTPSSPEFGTV